MDAWLSSGQGPQLHDRAYQGQREGEQSTPVRACSSPQVADFGLSKSLLPVDKHGQQVDLSSNTTYKLTGETGSYR